VFGLLMPENVLFFCVCSENKSTVRLFVKFS